MAAADYWLCDQCGAKAFYDAGLNYDVDGPIRPDDHRPLPEGCGDARVLCVACVKTHRVVILEIDNP